MLFSSLGSPTTGFCLARSAPAAAALGLGVALAGCSPGVPFDDPTAQYTQRTMLVSTDGGDASAANVAIQTPTPWPRHVNNTNIPANGTRMAKAIQNYESGASSGPSSQSSTSSGSLGAGLGIGSNSNNGASTGMTSSPSSPPAGQ